MRSAFGRTGCYDISIHTVNGSNWPKNTSFIWFGWHVHFFNLHYDIVFNQGKYKIYGNEMLFRIIIAGTKNSVREKFARNVYFPVVHARDLIYFSNIWELVLF